MTRLIYITHPATQIDPQIPVARWNISEEGRKQLMSLIKKPFWKDVDVIYTSQEPKALRSAVEISSRIPHLKFPIMFGNKELGEIDRSSTGVISRAEHNNAIEEFYLHPKNSYNGWETANSATKRIMHVISQIMDDNVGKTVAIIGHGAVGTLIICAVRRVHPTITEDPRKQGCIVEIDWDNKTVLSSWEQY